MGDYPQQSMAMRQRQAKGRSSMPINIQEADTENSYSATQQVELPAA
jgi:hypothetical protein